MLRMLRAWGVSSPGDRELVINIFLPGVEARDMSRDCDVTDEVIEEDRVKVGTRSVRRR